MVWIRVTMEQLIEIEMWNPKMGETGQEEGG